MAPLDNASVAKNQKIGGGVAAIYRGALQKKNPGARINRRKTVYKAKPFREEKPHPIGARITM